VGVHRARLELLIGIFVYEKSPNNVLRQLSYIKENNINKLGLSCAKLR
jgi:hypothetical protein